MPDNQFPGGYGDFLNFGNDPLRKEEKELQELIKKLFKKLNGANPLPIVNEDIMHYLRVINFNFATLQRFIQTLCIRQGLIEDNILEVQKKQVEILEKMSIFLESQMLLEESLDNEPNDDSITSEPV